MIDIWDESDPPPKKKFMFSDSSLIDPSELQFVPAGSIIAVCELRDDAPKNFKDSGKPSIWFVLNDQGTCLVIDEKKFPDGETEDIDWFIHWRVHLLGERSKRDPSF